LRAAIERANYLYSDGNKIQSLIPSNWDVAILIDSDNNVISVDSEISATARDGNTIENNKDAGIRSFGDNNRIAGSIITDNGSGIYLSGDSNVVGTDGDGQADGIEGNVSSGSPQPPHPPPSFARLGGKLGWLPAVVDRRPLTTLYRSDRMDDRERPFLRRPTV
jgi:hypothetical protein